MSTLDDYINKWEAMLEKYDAKAERLDAEARLRYQDWRQNMGAQFQAVGDWTEAAWKEFAADVEQKWYEAGLEESDDKTS